MMLNDPPNDSNPAVNSTMNGCHIAVMVLLPTAFTITITRMPSKRENQLSSNIENAASSNNNKQQEQKLPHHFLLTKAVGRITQVASAER